MTSAVGTPDAPSDAGVVLAGGELRYSTVWEDQLLLERGLEPRAGNDLLVIASAGDNVLNLLLREPRRIVALDINPAQSALVELQVTAIATLEHGEFLQLFGFAVDRPAAVSLYERVRPKLSAATRDWWDDRVAIIRRGIAASGRLELYIDSFRRLHLDGSRERALIDALLSASNPAEQRRRAAHVFTPELRNAFAQHFSAENLGLRARDPSQMRYVADDFDVTAHLLSRLEWVCTELPLAGNFYVERFLRGRIRDIEMGPSYLRRENFARLRGLVSRVEIVTADLGDYLASSAPQSLDHAALSDVFEYLSEEASAALFDRLADVIRPGGRVAYWNLFVPRAGAPTTPRLRWLEELSNRLLASDRSWFYRAFRVEEVVT